MGHKMKNIVVMFKVLAISVYGFCCKNKIIFNIKKVSRKSLMPRDCFIIDAECNSFYKVQYSFLHSGIW